MISLKAKADKYRKITFGPFHRYSIFFHHSNRPGIEGQWMIDDAETPDPVCDGCPSIIFQGSFEDAIKKADELNED